MLLDLPTAKKALTNVCTNAPADARFQLKIKNKSGFSITIPQLKFPGFLEPGQYEFFAFQSNPEGEFLEVLSAELVIEAMEESTPKAVNYEQPQPVSQQATQQTNRQYQEFVSPDFILKLLEKDQAVFSNERKLHDEKVSMIMQNHTKEIERIKEAHQKEITSLKESHSIEVNNLKTLNEKIDAERDKIRESIEKQLRGERKEQARAGKKSVWDIIADFVEKNPDEILAFIQSKDRGNSQTETRYSNLQEAIKEAREAGL
ncbi:MAG TPA: hypothetical protein PKX55_17580 [Leptospiraceae bacterium]|nr:hypothetical protein [Leptospiraceae bacterium]